VWKAAGWVNSKAAGAGAWGAGSGCGGPESQAQSVGPDLGSHRELREHRGLGLIIPFAAFAVLARHFSGPGPGVLRVMAALFGLRWASTRQARAQLRRLGFLIPLGPVRWP
jgi:hypothetical protein